MVFRDYLYIERKLNPMNKFFKYLIDIERDRSHASRWSKLPPRRERRLNILKGKNNKNG